MFYVIEGYGPGETDAATDGCIAVREVFEPEAGETAETTRQPYDWSNIAFAPQYCERKRAEYDERLAS